MNRDEQLEDREGTLGLKKDKGAYQKWTIEPVEGSTDKFYVTSYFESQLEDRDGTVGLSTDKGAYQQWTITNELGIVPCGVQPEEQEEQEEQEEDSYSDSDSYGPLFQPSL